MTGDRTCETCKWFCLAHKLERHSLGFCRRNAPTLKSWPSVTSTMFCGQHEGRPADQCGKGVSMAGERMCGTCRFWDEQGPIATPRDVRAGHCHRFPPTPGPDELIAEHWWCGEWRTKGMEWPANRGNYICGKCGRLGLYSPEANCCTRCDPNSPDYAMDQRDREGKV